MSLLLGVCMRRALKAMRAPAPGADRPFGRIRPSPPIVLLSTNQCSYSTRSTILKILCVPISLNVSPSRGIKHIDAQRCSWDSCSACTTRLDLLTLASADSALGEHVCAAARMN